MLRTVARNISRSSISSPPSLPKISYRSFSEKLAIPVDAEQQGGRRKEELDVEAAGGVGFNKDPIVPPSNAGTKENPIAVSTFSNSFFLEFFNQSSYQPIYNQVPSAHSVRAVGYEDPVTHQLVWFNLSRGPLHYIPDIGLYFQLK